VDERTRRRRIGCAAGIVLIVLLVAAIAIPNLTATRIASNEDVAIAGLRAYVRAQEEFRKVDRYGIGRKVYANPKDGSGFRDLYHVGYDGTTDPEEPAPHLIDRTFAQTDIDLAERCPKAGHLFANITGDADGPYDYTRQFGLCAMPYSYGRAGRNMFIVDHRGRVYQRDVSFNVVRAGWPPEPVTTWPDVKKEGWTPVED
jgi:type II secretory pathway pseudopilin PulG